MYDKYLFILLLLGTTFSFTNGGTTTIRPTTHKTTTRETTTRETTTRGIVLPQRYQHVEGTNYLYKIHKIRKPFDTAKQTCEDEGATLFYPENEREAEAVILYAESILAVSKNKYLLIGLRKTKDNFKTIDKGSSINDVYHKWGKDEPNNYGGIENCVSLGYSRKDAEPMKIWLNDIPCCAMKPFVCKMSMEPSEQAEVYSAADSDEDTTDEPATMAPGSGSFEGYYHVAGTTHFYKLHTSRVTFKLAKQTCDGEGSTLFYPQNELEAEAVLQYCQNTTNSPQALMLGLKRSADTFVSIDNGTSINQLYHNWLKGEPNNIEESEECVELKHAKADKETVMGLNDIYCCEKRAFVCKKPLETSYTNTN